MESSILIGAAVSGSACSSSMLPGGHCNGADYITLLLSHARTSALSAQHEPAPLPPVDLLEERVPLDLVRAVHAQALCRVPRQQASYKLTDAACEAAPRYW